MASTFGMISRCAKVAADSAIQRCSSSRCSKVKILSAFSLTGVVRNAVPASVGFMVVDICDFFSLNQVQPRGRHKRPLPTPHYPRPYAAAHLNYDGLNGSLSSRFNTLPMSVFGRLSRNSINLGTL